MNVQVQTKETTPYQDQRPGTSGLRKKVTHVQQPNYIENFIQGLFNILPEVQGQTLVVGGDGRYYNDVVIQKIIKIACANGIGKLLVGKSGIFSTPAVSCVIRKKSCYGGILLTASHNPGGPTEDFGIKYNSGNGGPAVSSVTEAIWENTKNITSYKIADLPDIDLDTIGSHTFGDFSIEIVDPLEDYIEQMQQIFDFDAIKAFLQKTDLLLDSLNGVTGPYILGLFKDILGVSETNYQKVECLPDFGGSHPDPNLVYAKELVDRMYADEENFFFGAAFDGDGDRNMVLGRKFFVTPSDSVAIIAANAQLIPFYKEGLVAVSRSMPTSGALDLVSKKLDIPFYEVPTGWKFFGNLMDMYEEQGSSAFICGEESFGTGSAHIREKDGIWAILAWISILAAKNEGRDELLSVEDIVRDHWTTFGRNYYSRHDYENCESDGANAMMESLNEKVLSLSKGDKLGDFVIDYADNFEYTDPVDGSVSSNQGIRFVFEDGSRIIFRLSGTGSVGATIRLYIEKYEPEKEKHDQETQDALAELISLALSVSDIEKFTGRKEPTVIT